MREQLCFGAFEEGLAFLLVGLLDEELVVECDVVLDVLAE